MNKGEQTKQKILDTALTLFSTKGYEETSLNDIAAIVGIKAPSIYGHFSSKEQLFEQVTAYVTANYIKFINERAVYLQPLSIKEKLYDLLVELNTYFFKNDLGLFIKRYCLIPPEKFKELLNEEYAQSEREIKKILYAILESEQNERFIDKETIVDAFLSVLDGTLFYLINYSYEEYERRLNHSWEVFWNGILKVN